MWRTLVVGVMTVALAALGAAAQVRTGSEPEPSHDVVRDVVRMLESNVEPSLILEWLAGVEDPPSGLTADDMILLTRAGAPESVIRKILDPAGAPAAEARPAPPAPTGRPAAEAGVESCCLVYFSILYRPTFDSEAGDEVWDLYVYLDGNLLGHAGTGKRNAVDVGTTVGPGEHTVRLLMENHTRSGKGDDATVRHEALVAPEVTRFEIDEPADWKFELDWHETMMSKGPLGWSLLRDGKEVGGESGLGTRREQWQPLCEDIEASVAPGQPTPAWAERQLGRCVRWNDLWPGVEPLPSRDEARSAPPA